MNDLQETAVSQKLTTRWLGQHYEYHPTVGSTNNLLKEQVAAGTAEKPAAGTVILTDFQSRGRGRLQRHWQAPAGSSLLFSALFRPGWHGERMAWLTMLAGLAVVEAIKTVADLDVALKWPNDVVWQQGGVWHKLCGLLLAGHVGDEGRLETAVLGVGLNVNIPASHMPRGNTVPTSLLVACKKPVSRLLLLAELLKNLEKGYDSADRGKSPRAAWNRKLITLGQPVEVTTIANRVTLSGVAEDTDEFGQLLVRDGNGRLHPVSAGDVTLRNC